PQTVSKIKTNLNLNQLAKNGTAVANVANGGSAAGAADWYAWGLQDGADQGLGGDDVTSVGAQSFPSAGYMQVAIATANRFSNPSDFEFDVLVDVNGDGKDDYDVVAVNFGLLTTGSPDDQYAVAVINQHTEDGSIHWLADAPLDGSSVVMRVDFD